MYPAGLAASRLSSLSIGESAYVIPADGAVVDDNVLQNGHNSQQEVVARTGRKKGDQQDGTYPGPQSDSIPLHEPKSQVHGSLSPGEVDWRTFLTSKRFGTSPVAGFMSTSAAIDSIQAWSVALFMVSGTSQRTSHVVRGCVEGKVEERGENGLWPDLAATADPVLLIPPDTACSTV